MICVDCRKEKEGREIMSSWQFGSHMEFRCLCVKCYDKQMKQLQDRLNDKGIPEITQANLSGMVIAYEDTIKS